MVCTSCSKREASIHITQIVNGKTTRIDLCPSCAKEQGYLGDAGEGVGGFFGGDPFGGTGLNLFQMAGGMSGISGAAFAGERCAYCGTSFDEFRGRGLLGCSHCYEEFGARLLPVIRRIQAGDVHTGRRPAGSAPPAPEAPAKERKPLLRRPLRIPKKKPGEGEPDAKAGASTSSAPAPAGASASAPTPAPAAPPPAEGEAARLRREQAAAVATEDYEKAAKLRDRIRTLEAKESKDAKESKGKGGDPA